MFDPWVLLCWNPRVCYEYDDHLWESCCFPPWIEWCKHGNLGHFSTFPFKYLSFVFGQSVIRRPTHSHFPQVTVFFPFLKVLVSGPCFDHLFLEVPPRQGHVHLVRTWSPGVLSSPSLTPLGNLLWSDGAQSDSWPSSFLVLKEHNHLCPHQGQRDWDVAPPPSDVCPRAAGGVSGIGFPQESFFDGGNVIEDSAIFWHLRI